MIRAIFTCIALLLPGSLLAQACGTENLLDSLSGAERARLDGLVAPHVYPEGNLWLAEKPGSTVTVIGTIHLPDPRLSEYVAAVRPALDAADLLILEASMGDEAGLPQLVAERPDMFFITEGPTLIDLLGEEAWGQIAERLTAMGIPAFFAAQFQPWYLSMTLAVPPCAVQAMQAGGKGLDRQLEEIAEARGTTLATLDDLEAVLRLFSDEPLEKQLDGLRVNLQLQADPAATSTVIEAYFDGQVRAAWEYGRIQVEAAGIADGAALFEEVNQSLLIDRNRQWEPKIARLVEGQDVVLAVGAAHLSGESGVLRALERAGYTVSPLPR
ncbi:MAG: TraB/GumN family protein [Silicimonas sp.]|nr:TraB/GumN family protein [Silicimonas sp.]